MLESHCSSLPTAHVLSHSPIFASGYYAVFPTDNDWSHVHSKRFAYFKTKLCYFCNKCISEIIVQNITILEEPAIEDKETRITATMSNQKKWSNYISTIILSLLLHILHFCILGLFVVLLHTEDTQTLLSADT